MGFARPNCFDLTLAVVAALAVYGCAVSDSFDPLMPTGVGGDPEIGGTFGAGGAGLSTGAGGAMGVAGVQCTGFGGDTGLAGSTGIAGTGGLVRFAKDLHHLLLSEPALTHRSSVLEGMLSGLNWSENRQAGQRRQRHITMGQIDASFCSPGSFFGPWALLASLLSRAGIEGDAMDFEEIAL